MKKNHKNKFKTPEGYFESFNERLLDKIAQEESNIPTHDGFVVPEGYLAALPSKIQDKIKTEPKVVPLFAKYKKYMWAAAAVALVLALSNVFTKERSAALTFEDLASAELEVYFQDNGLELTSYELAEVVDLDAINILDITETSNAVENDLILEYLDENVDAIEDLNISYEELE